jgi:hypothetical protein
MYHGPLQEIHGIGGGDWAMERPHHHESSRIPRCVHCDHLADIEERLSSTTRDLMVGLMDSRTIWIERRRRATAPQRDMARDPPPAAENGAEP